MRKRGFSDPFPKLPPGCTPSDIDRAFGEQECSFCGNVEAEGHGMGCPSHPETEYCSVCNPLPHNHSHVGDVFCSNHTEADLREKRRAHEQYSEYDSGIIHDDEQRDDSDDC